jgi:hypothetical protein
VAANPNIESRVVRKFSLDRSLHGGSALTRSFKITRKVRSEKLADYSGAAGAVMRLSWNEIRARAAHFADEWKDAHYEKGQAQTFYNEFFEVFGVTRRRVASFEEPVKKLDGKHGFMPRSCCAGRIARWGAPFCRLAEGRAARGRRRDRLDWRARQPPNRAGRATRRQKGTGEARRRQSEARFSG